MKARKESIPASSKSRLVAALQILVAIGEVTGDEDLATRMRQELGAAQAVQR
jgi:hypothetical protein